MRRNTVLTRPAGSLLPALSRDYLESEALSLLTRLEQVQPFPLTMPMVPAARISDEAMRAITVHVRKSIRHLQRQIHQFAHGVRGASAPDDRIQAAFALLKLRFNAILDQLDIFADVLSQRAEHYTGIWVAGLDVLANDAMRLNVRLYDPPPVMCFLERGHGAAIRRARTRLPGGDLNPVAIIQVPRERMVGSGIAASLIHEVGHQGAALLDLVNSLRIDLQQRQAREPANIAWKFLHRWISEIISDFWAMAHLGIGATLGLMGVVSLPRYFMFRFGFDDPHPFPWIRVKLSLAFGKVLFPDPQWKIVESLWNRIYPLAGLPPDKLAIIRALEAALPEFVKIVINHRNTALRGRPLQAVFPIAQRQPAYLRSLGLAWARNPRLSGQAPPSLVFAVVGQARADSRISAAGESRLLGRLLTKWAFERTENRAKMTGESTDM